MMVILISSTNTTKVEQQTEGKLLFVELDTKDIQMKELLVRDTDH